MDLSVLPFSVLTPASWAPSVLEDPIALLIDHAHLEQKAASNALALLHRWPESNPEPDVAQRWSHELSEIARDETAHLTLVLKILEKRGAPFPKSHENTYARGLRDLERRTRAPDNLIDRLFVSALIEARSCERFYCLAEACEDAELKKLYRGLWSSEHNHYKVFLELAADVEQDEELRETRWKEMLEGEEKILQEQAPGARIHSWV